MRASVRVVAAVVGAVTSIMSASLAVGSTLSKNIPGAIRHPFHEAAKAVGVDKSKHHRTYYSTTTQHRVYSRGRTVHSYSTHRRARHKPTHRRVVRKHHYAS